MSTQDPGAADDRDRAPELRSGAWFTGDDEVAVMHRVALRNVGIEIDSASTRPLIGVADSSSTLNPCNAPLRGLVPSVVAGIEAAGGIPCVFPVMSLGEDLMKPSAMLYRNLLAMEVEEYALSNPLDGLVLLGNCDKSIPGALLGAISANLPTVVLSAGARPAGLFRGARLGTGTDLWRAWDDRRAGLLDDEAWAQFERALSCGPGACNTMGTASSMAIVTEVLGLMLPGTATIPAGSAAQTEAANATGRAAVEAVIADRRPQTLLGRAGFLNAFAALCAVGGSTNVVLHLLALAGRAGVELSLDDLDASARRVPVIADVEPAGAHLIQEFDAAGGVPALLRELRRDAGELIDATAPCATGETWDHELRLRGDRPRRRDPGACPAIRPTSAPLVPTEAFAVLRGSLAPGGALLKTASCSRRLLHHTGPALVFHEYTDMIARLDDPDLDVTPDTVLVLAGAGPVGAPGMPEWGMIPIPRVLAERGVRDVVRISDARMSGTSFGTCLVHVAPEAAVGGPLALVRTGDPVRVDLDARTLDLLIPDAELAARRAAWTPPPARHLRGWPLLYRRHVTQADTGCDRDFLTAETAGKRAVVPAPIGRS